MSKEKLSVQLNKIKSVYGEFVNNIIEDGFVWFNMWHSKEVSNEMEFIEVLSEKKFLPSIKTCIMITISLPATTCSVERSFR